MLLNLNFDQNYDLRLGEEAISGKVSFINVLMEKNKFAGCEFFSL